MIATDYEDFWFCGNFAQLVQSGPDTVIMGRLPYTPRSKKVLEYATQASQTLCHNYVGTEHLLLGMIREEEGIAAQVLFHKGLTAELVHAAILKVLATQEAELLQPNALSAQ